MGNTNSFSSYISLKPKCPPYLNVIVAIETAMTSLFSPILRCFIVAVYMTYKFLFEQKPFLQKLNPIYPFSTFLQTVWSHLKQLNILSEVHG